MAIAEKLVGLALQELKEEDGRIIHFLNVDHNCNVDTDGIDKLIFLAGGLCLPLQVKKKNGEVTHHRKCHPHVKAVIVVKSKRHGQDDVKQIKSYAGLIIIAVNRGKIKNGEEDQEETIRNVKQALLIILDLSVEEFKKSILI